MDLATLEARYGDAVLKMDVAAPVDLLYMFRDGLIEMPNLDAPSTTLSGEAGVFVAGSLNVEEELVLTGHALFVAGDVSAKKISLQGNMVVMGDLVAEEVRGNFEPYTLTVMGEVHIGLAVMTRGFILQLLGRGQVKRLVDTGPEELIKLWQEAGSTVTVGSMSRKESRPEVRGTEYDPVGQVDLERRGTMAELHQHWGAPFEAAYLVLRHRRGRRAQPN